MKANELRIGNWVMGNEPYQITIQHLTIQCAYEFGDRDNYFEPIPLTEEWFTKQIIFQLQVAFLDYRITNDDCLIYYQDVLLTSIKYIHQLQNLYHALTNTELIWNGEK